MNAANETAVQAFMDQRIALSDIPRVIESVMNDHAPHKVSSIELVLETDRDARREAAKVIDTISHEVEFPVLRLV
jgi:1-deoxy-D-xylulose-5-phosphate reductoisomerase